MSEILDRVFPEPDGEWIGASLFAISRLVFSDFINLTDTYGYTEKTALKLATQEVADWSEDVRYKLRGY
jgi:hypothetical protein